MKTAGSLLLGISPGGGEGWNTTGPGGGTGGLDGGSVIIEGAGLG